MPRDGSGIYSIPAGTQGTPDTTIESAKYNAYIADVATDLNAPRPIVAGGTGATNAASARTALGAEVAMQVVTNYDSHVFETGSFKSDVGATSSPDGGSPATNKYAGSVQVFDASNAVVQARNLTTGIIYFRKKLAGVWGAWNLDGGAGTFVQKFGDTMTGGLIIDEPTGDTELTLDTTGSPNRSLIWGTKNGLPRWRITMVGSGAETGANAGSDFNIIAFDDAGAQLSVPFNVTRATGAVAFASTVTVAAPTAGGHATTKTYADTQDALKVSKAGDTMTGDLQISKANPNINIVKSAAAQQCGITGALATAGNRWFMSLGNSTAESGSNVGSDFTLYRYADNGAFIGSVLNIARSNGYATLTGGMQLDAALTVHGGGGWAFGWQQNGTDAFYCGRMSGSSLITNVFELHTSFIASMVNALKPGGGPWGDTSDARIKNVAGNYTRGLDELLQLQPVRYTFKGNDQRVGEGPVLADAEQQSEEGAPYRDSPHYDVAVSGKEFVGLIAQDAEAAFPEMVTQRVGKIDGVEVSDVRDLDTAPLIFALVNAVKTLAARVEALEGAG